MLFENFITGLKKNILTGFIANNPEYFLDTLIECLGTLNAGTIFTSNIFFNPENPQSDPEKKCCALNVGANANDKLTINAKTTFTNKCTFNTNATFKEDITFEKQLTAKQIVATETVEGIDKLRYELVNVNYIGIIESFLYLTGYTATLGGDVSLIYTGGLQGESARFINTSENVVNLRYVGANGINYPLRNVSLAPSTGVELIRYGSGWVAMR